MTPIVHKVMGGADSVRMPAASMKSFLGDAALGRHPRRRVLVQQGIELGPAFGVVGDVLLVDVAPVPQQSKQAVDQHQVGAGPDGQMRSGHPSQCGAPRIDNDARGAPGNPLLDSLVGDRMAIGGIRPDKQESVAQLDVSIASGRPVAAQRQRHTGGGMAMQSRLLLSTWFVRRYALPNLFAMYCASVVSCPRDRRRSRRAMRLKDPMQPLGGPA